MRENVVEIPMAELPIISGNGIIPAEWPDEEFELYSVPSFDEGKPEISLGKEIGSNKQTVSEGNVLLCKINPRINRAWIVGSFSGRRQIASTEWIVFDSVPSLNPRYLMHFLRNYDLHNYLASHASGVGGSLMRIKPSTFSDQLFPLFSFNDQSRIVSKLEELFSDLDAAVAELKAAQRKLVRYRQSLLKAAVEGSLTAEWRKANKPAESGARLLERILAERRRRWEEKQLAKFAEQGKAPPSGWRDKYPEPVKPDTTALPELPEGWVWGSVGQLISVLTSGSRDWAPYYDRGSCVFVMAQNVRPWRPDFSFIQHIDPPVDHRDRGRSQVMANDLLVTIVGANTGDVCRIEASLDSYYVCQSVALMRPVLLEFSEFLNAVLNSEGHGQREFREMNYGAGRPHLSFDQLEAVHVPVPPMSEQSKIIAFINEEFTACDETAAEVTVLLRQAAAQRQNILKAAFSGKLVSQDPADEPASALLERIRAERAAGGGKAKGRRGRKGKESSSAGS